MRAKHAEELRLPHAIQVFEFVFQFVHARNAQDRIEDDDRTLKIYRSSIRTGNYLHFMDIYSGQTISFKTQFNGEHDGTCKKAHGLQARDIHPFIVNMEFENFGSFGIALFSLCETGVYLSTANLDNVTSAVQIDFENRILLQSKQTFWRVQLLQINEHTGIAIYDHNRVFATGHASGHFLQMFKLTNTGEIQLLVRRYVQPGITYRVVPLIHNGHLYYFNKFGDLIEYDYCSGMYTIDEGLIPTFKGSDQGAWHGSCFYYMYTIEFEHYEFGFFDMQTKKFSILHLPDNIPPDWKTQFHKDLSSHPLIFVDKYAVLNLLPVNMGREEECKNVEQLSFYPPCPMSLFRIPLRLPETLSNLSYFAILKKPRPIQQQFEHIVRNLNSGFTGRIKSSPPKCKPNLNDGRRSQ